jgi:hypothetical protein
MWVLIARAPKPNVAYWPRRSWLASLDAVAWPALWAAAIVTVPFSTGIVGNVGLSFVVLVDARRLHTAILRNERYWFTIRRWGLPLAGLVAVGAATNLLS